MRQILLLNLLALFLLGCEQYDKRLFGPWETIHDENNNLSPQLTDSAFFLPGNVLKIFHCNNRKLVKSSTGTYYFNRKTQTLNTQIRFYYEADTTIVKYKIARLNDTSMVLEQIGGEYKSTLHLRKLKI
jgi:hypothetical protein